MNPPLTFLLSLTFLFLFSGSVYGQEPVVKQELYRGGMSIEQGVPQDNKEAVRLLRLSAEQGNAKAQSNLGAMY
jgi:hypothetical protein